MNCPTCSGAGKVPLMNADGEPIFIPCPSCRGLSARVQPCPSCSDGPLPEDPNDHP